MITFSDHVFFFPMIIYICEQLLYSRLALCKTIGAQTAAQNHAPLLPNPVAVQLGLDEANGPSAVLAQAMEALGGGGGGGGGGPSGSGTQTDARPPGGSNDDGTSATAAASAILPAPTNVLYMYLLDACEKVFDGEMDQATFEEHMRWFFGTKVRALMFLDACASG